MMLALAVGLAGCQTSSIDAPAATAAIAGQQLLAADLAGLLDNKATKLAIGAEYRALESTTTGTPVNWKASDGVSGYVVPQQTYSVGSTNCRGLVHTVSVAGTIRSVSAAACRTEQGGWQVLS